MSSNPAVVFLHGIGASPGLDWLEPLNRALALHGHEPIPASGVVTPDYRHILAGQGTIRGEVLPTRKWQRPKGGEWDAGRVAFWARHGRLSSRLEGLAADRSGVFGYVPESAGDAVAKRLKSVDEARRYRDDASVRAAVLRTVLEDMPSGPVLIIGHSLGSVVTGDVLKRLPDDVRVIGVVTIGSPMGSVSTLRSLCDLSPFPYDRVGAWVNVYEPCDVVTGGRGFSKYVPQVIDVPITLKNLRLDPPDVPLPLVAEHDAGEYLGHPTCGAVVGALLHGRALERSRAADPLHPALALLLLQAVFARELQLALPKQSGKPFDRLHAARSLQAEGIAELSSSLPTGRTVTAEEVLRDCDDLVGGASLGKRELIWLGAALIGADPIHPFDVERECDAKTVELALARTLERLAKSPDVLAPHSAQEVAAELSEGRRLALKAFKSAGPVLPKVALGLGVLMLAATGFGLAAAVPAGLYGGAAIVTTLVAFGPGGIAGGAATLALLTGVTGALTGAGAIGEVQGRARRAQPGMLPLDMLREALRTGDAASAQALLTILMGHTHAAESLGAESPRLQYRAETAAALDAARASLNRTREIAPGGKAVKALSAKVDALATGLDWFAGTSDDSRAGKQIQSSSKQFAREVEGGSRKDKRSPEGQRAIAAGQGGSEAT